MSDEYITRVVDAGAGGADLFVLGIFAWALLGFSNVYYGNAQLVLGETIAAVQTKKSMAISRTMAYHPEVQHAIAEMVIEMEAVGAYIDRTAEDWANGVDHCHNWP